VLHTSSHSAMLAWNVCQKQAENARQSGTQGAFAGDTCLFCHVRDEPFEAEKLSHEREV